MSSILKIVDEELAFAEMCVANGGYLPVMVASSIAGVSRQYVYRLAKKKRVEAILVNGQFFFNVPDLIRFRVERRSRQLDNYASSEDEASLRQSSYEADTNNTGLEII